MAELSALRVLLADAKKNLEEARAQYEDVRRTFGLAAAVDPDAKKKISEAEKRVQALTRQVQDLERQLAEAEAAEAKRREEEAKAAAKRKEEAEKALPKAAKEYRRAVEALATKVLEARGKIAPVLAEVLDAEVQAYRAYENVRTLARQAENVRGAERLLAAVFKDFAWVPEADAAAQEDLERLYKLLAARIAWPLTILDPVMPPPPRIRREMRAEIAKRLAERAKARAARGTA